MTQKDNVHLNPFVRFWGVLVFCFLFLALCILSLGLFHGESAVSVQDGAHTSPALAEIPLIEDLVPQDDSDLPIVEVSFNEDSATEETSLFSEGLADSFGVVVNGADVHDNIYSIIADIRRDLRPDNVTMVDKLALISVVGRNMSRRTGTSGKVFGALGEEGINIRMITQSSQEISIIVGVDEADFERAIRVIYERFVRNEMVSK